MDLLDPGYLLEIEQEKSMNMRPCRCSNCDPQGAARVIRLLPQTKSNDFNQMMLSVPSGQEDKSLLNIPKTGRKRKAVSNVPLVCKWNDPIRLDVSMIDLTVSILGNYESRFKEFYPTDPPYLPETLLSREEAWQITKNYKSVAEGVFLREILGGQSIPGLFDLIESSIQAWLRSSSYKDHQTHLEDIQISIDQDILDTELIEQEHEEELRLKALAREVKLQGIADRKRIRAEKAAELVRMKEKKRKDKNQDIRHLTSTSGSI